MIDPSILHQNPDDTRFQFDVIKSLADSVRQMAGTQTQILERLARIEEQRTHEAVAAVSERVAVLEVDMNKRTGMMNAIGALPKVVAFIVTLCTIFSAIYLAGRATGVIHAPPQASARLEATVHPEEQRIEGTVGGRP